MIDKNLLQAVSTIIFFANEVESGAILNEVDKGYVDEARTMFQQFGGLRTIDAILYWRQNGQITRDPRRNGRRP